MATRNPNERCLKNFAHHFIYKEFSENPQHFTQNVATPCLRLVRLEYMTTQAFPFTIANPLPQASLISCAANCFLTYQHGCQHQPTASERYCLEPEMLR
jgi:hypothetical protein